MRKTARREVERLASEERLSPVFRVLLSVVVLVVFASSWMTDFAYHHALAERALDRAGIGERGLKKSPPWRCPYGRGEDFGGNRHDQEVQGYVCTSLFLPTELHEIPFSADWKAGLGD